MISCESRGIGLVGKALAAQGSSAKADVHPEDKEQLLLLLSDLGHFCRA